MHKNPKILILGSGQIATACLDVATRQLRVRRDRSERDKNDIYIVSMSRKDLDIRDFSFPDKIIKRVGGMPDVIINGMAYTDVDGAEDDEELAMHVNRDAVDILASFCREAKNNPLLIHFSTDYVFDGIDTPSGGYVETSKTNPLSVYGRSKLGGEYAVTDIMANMPHYVIRTSSLWRPGPFKNFVETVIEFMTDGKGMQIRDNQFMRPTCAFDLAHEVISMADRHLRNEPYEYGLYHISNSGTATWFKFAQAIAMRALGSEFPDQLSPTDRYFTKALRPRDSRLDCSKWEAVRGLPMRSWEESIREQPPLRIHHV